MIEINRDETIKEIKKALEARSGHKWSVTGGRGTEYGWIKIHVAPKDRNQYGYMSDEAAKELAELLGMAKGGGWESYLQGCDIPDSFDYYREYIDRARGESPKVLAQKYWD